MINHDRYAKATYGFMHPRFGRKHKSESRDKIKDARSKQIVSHSSETKAKIGAGNKGKIVSMDHINKMINARSGKPVWNKVIIDDYLSTLITGFYNSSKSLKKTYQLFNLSKDVTTRILHESAIRNIPA